MSSRLFRALTMVLVLGLLLLPMAALAEDTVDAVHGTVFNDSNQDGIFDDPSEVGIPDVLVKVYEAGVPTAIATTTTNPSGYYEISGLSPGSYTVVETDPVTHVSTTPNEVAFEIDGSTPVPTVDFGDFLIADLCQISGTVYDDLDRSRLFDTGDGVLGGVTILLKDAEGVQIDFTETDVDGTYSFDELFPGTYTLREQDPEGYYSTTPHEVTVTLLAGESIEDVDFGDFIPEPGEVSPIDLPITRFFDLPLLDVLELRSIDGMGYGNIAKVYFLSYLSGMEVGDILALRETDGGWGNVMKAVLGHAGLKGYNLGLIMSGREVPNQVQKMIDDCPVVETQEQVQALMASGANQGSLKKLCGMVMDADGDFDALMSAVQMRADKMKWEDIQDALENPVPPASTLEDDKVNGPPACKGYNKDNPECK